MMMRHATTRLERAARSVRAAVAGLQTNCFSGARSRWIRGLRAENADAIGIEPVHTRVDSRGLRWTPGVRPGRSGRPTELNPSRARHRRDRIAVACR